MELYCVESGEVLLAKNKAISHLPAAPAMLVCMKTTDGEGRGGACRMQVTSANESNSSHMLAAITIFTNYGRGCGSGEGGAQSSTSRAAGRREKLLVRELSWERKVSIITNIGIII